MNKLHVILGMVRMECYDQLAAYVSSIAKARQTEVSTITRQIRDPVMAGFLLGKLSRAREAGAELVLTPTSALPAPADAETVNELITIVGNLIDNALEAVTNWPRKLVTVDIAFRDGVLNVSVTDSGPGVAPEIRDSIVAKGFSTKAHDRGFGLFLVRRGLEKLGGDIELAGGDADGSCFTVTLPYQPAEEGTA